MLNQREVEDLRAKAECAMAEPRLIQRKSATTILALIAEYDLRGSVRTTIIPVPGNIKGAISFLRGAFDNDGAEGESVHLVCRVLEDMIEERDSPHIAGFLESVKTEALHQRARYGADHDAGKAPPDWFWTLGYLAGKALVASAAGDTEKALHHTISSAALLLNWHAALSGVDNQMRPGVDHPDE